MNRYTIYKKNPNFCKYIKVQEVLSALAVPRVGEIIRVDITKGGNGLKLYRVTEIIHRISRTWDAIAVVVEPIDPKSTDLLSAL